MTQFDDLDNMEQDAILDSISKRFDEYAELNIREIQTMNMDFSRLIHQELTLMRTEIQKLADIQLVQLDSHQLDKLQELNAERFAKLQFRNLPTAKEN